MNAGRETSQLSFGAAWAATPAQVAEAQRLRFRVFVDELRASPDLPSGSPDAHEIDRFDPFCDHLLLRANSGVRRGEVIATCRVLTPEGAALAGGRYTSSEFDLGPISDLLPDAIEMGRVCVDPAWRNGLLIMAMWRAVGEHMTQRNLNTLIGCASVNLADGGELASQIWRRLERTHMAPLAQRVRPWTSLRLHHAGVDNRVAVPALMKGYLRCGARLLGPPAVDRAFNTADFPMIANIADLPPRYTRRVFSAPASRHAKEILDEPDVGR